MPLTAPPVDGVLAPAVERLGAAVAALVDETPVWDREHGVCRWSAAVYPRLRAALTAKALGMRASAKSRPPCSIQALDLLVEVDQTVQGWMGGRLFTKFGNTESRTKCTTDRLHGLAEQPYRPQDVTLLDGFSAAIEGWVLAAVTLLGDAPVTVALRRPCPACDSRWAYRRVGHEVIRMDALRAGEHGAECLNCRAFWAASEFAFLARLLEAAT